MLQKVLYYCLFSLFPTQKPAHIAPLLLPEFAQSLAEFLRSQWFLLQQLLGLALSDVEPVQGVGAPNVESV